jgi:hypothetical protein
MLAPRRETLSIYNEVRVLAWLGAVSIATGVGIIIKKHFDDIGPLTIAIAIGLAAAVCYLWVAFKKRAALDEYIVLLGALLISADVAFIESQWKFLGSQWHRHFLLLAILHAAAAYYFDSRPVMSLSVAALAAWIGVEREPASSTDYAIRAFTASALIGGWRLANRRAAFNPVFEHSAANLAFWGSLALATSRDTRLLGVGIALMLASLAVAYGFRRQRELFIVYGYVYGLIAINIVVFDIVREETARVLLLLVSTVAVIVAMIVTHLRLRR